MINNLRAALGARSITPPSPGQLNNSSPAINSHESDYDVAASLTQFATQAKPAIEAKGYGRFQVEGTFNNGVPTGKCTIRLSGREYKCEFKQGKTAHPVKENEVIIIMNDSFYEGTVGDKPQGEITYNKNSKYKGAVKITEDIINGDFQVQAHDLERVLDEKGTFNPEGNLHGEDCFRLSENWIQSGKFNNGIYEGEETKLLSGATYKGPHINGKPHDEGVVTYPNGKSFRALFQNGELRRLESDFAKFEGVTFNENWLPCGRGEIKTGRTETDGKFEAEREYNGEFKDGVLISGRMYGALQGKGKIRPVYPVTEQRSSIDVPIF